MKKSVLKLALVLLFAVLSPVLVFTGYQFFTLSESEKVIEEIYRNQLDAILYSVNQYSVDVVNTWNNDIEAALKDRAKLDEIRENLFVSSYIVSNFIYDYETGDINIIEDTKNTGKVKSLINGILTENRDAVERLFTYKAANYLKNEPINLDIANLSLILFSPASKENKKLVCGVFFNTKDFVRLVLSQKIQEAASGQFYISVINKETSENIYQSENFDPGLITQTKDLWVIPGYSLGIVFKGRTIESLVEGRSFNNLILVSILALFVIAGVIITFRNLKREVELAQIKSDFVSNVSHELRTPLALISMFAETLEMGRVNSEEKKMEYYKIISHETNRLGRIVNTILNFSKMEAGKRTYDFMDTSVNEIVEKVLRTYEFHLKNKGFDVSVNKTDNLPLISADSEALSEAFINLLDNAVKYSNDKLLIEVFTGIKNGNVFIAVKDYGIGISEEFQQKIFEKFYRVTTGLIHDTKGTGLGLALVSQIVEVHNGSIELESEPGKGSIFTMYFTPKENLNTENQDVENSDS